MVARRTTGLRTTDDKTAGVKRRVIGYLLSVIGKTEYGTTGLQTTDDKTVDGGSGIKSNSRLGRRSWEGWRIDDVHDSLQNRDDDSLVNIESLFQFFFQRGKFLSQAALVPEQRTHLEECANDKHAHLNSPRAIQNICGHDRTVLSECVGPTATAASMS